MILQSLVASRDLHIVGVVTTPPAPVGPQKILTKTNVHLFAEKHHLPVSTPEFLTPEVNLPQADFFLVAGYGKLLPASWLKTPRLGAINLHFSLLPKFRGANPAEWAILLGETTTGVTLITMAEEFDTGSIIAQASLSITPQDTRETLYDKLYTLGARELPGMLKQYNSLKITPQGTSPTPTAYRFKRADGYIPWEIITAAVTGQAYDGSRLPSHLRTAYRYLQLNQSSDISHQSSFIARAIRALKGFPGVWTYAPSAKGKKRLKLLSAHLTNSRLILDQVQLEGLKATPFNQIKNQIL